MATNPLALMAGEAQALRELAALHRDPIYYGRGAPRGDGRTVVVVPGLFGNDAYLQPLRMWLGRIGYRPARSGLVLNAGCPQRLRNEIVANLKRRLDASPSPVALVGHSRGGMLSWALAAQMGDKVSHLVLLGSPAPAVVAMFRAKRDFASAKVARSAVADAGARALKLLDPDCAVPACGCEYTADLKRSLHPDTSVLSVFSSEDRIVHPSACRLDQGENVEVRGTHSGLVYNRDAYRHVARFLADATG